MIKWILLVWFASASNYNYAPTVVAEYSTREVCLNAANGWIRYASKEVKEGGDIDLHPQAICLPKQ